MTIAVQHRNTVGEGGNRGWNHIDGGSGVFHQGSKVGPFDIGERLTDAIQLPPFDRNQVPWGPAVNQTSFHLDGADSSGQIKADLCEVSSKRSDPVVADDGFSIGEDDAFGSFGIAIDFGEEFPR